MAQSMLQSIQVFARASRKPIRGIPETRGTKCHGCGLFECMATGKRTKPWRFYCDALRREVSPQRGKCAAGREDDSHGGPVVERFQGWMRRRLSEEGMTLADLARLSGVHSGQLGKYLAGVNTPKTPTRRRIEMVLGKYTGF